MKGQIVLLGKIMGKKEELIEEQLEKQAKLQKEIIDGENALADFQQKFALIEETSYNLSKQLDVINDEELQLNFQRVRQEFEENVHTANLKLEDMAEDLEKMKKAHQKELEDNKDNME